MRRQPSRRFAAGRSGEFRAPWRPTGSSASRREEFGFDAPRRAARRHGGGSWTARRPGRHVLHRGRQVGDLPDPALGSTPGRRPWSWSPLCWRSSASRSRTCGRGRRVARPRSAPPCRPPSGPRRSPPELAEDSAPQFTSPRRPKQLANPDALDELAVARPSLLVVWTRRTCISQRGLTIFRPDYLLLAASGRRCSGAGRPAGADRDARRRPPVRDEIVERRPIIWRDSPASHLRNSTGPQIICSYYGRAPPPRRGAQAAGRCASTSPPPRRPCIDVRHAAWRRGPGRLAVLTPVLRAASYHAGGCGAPMGEAAQTRFRWTAGPRRDRGHHGIRDGRRQAGDGPLGRARRNTALESLG